MEEIWRLHRDAGRPPLRKIVDQIASADRKGTASQETVRKILRGTTVPQWLTLATVLEALCELAGVEFIPDWPDPWSGSGESLHNRFKRLWNDAIDEEPAKAWDEEPPY